MLRSPACMLLGAFLLLVTGGAAGVLALFGGVYDVSAVRQHWGPVYWVLDTARARSLTVHSAGIRPPDLADASLLAEGLRLFDRHCVTCHGAPGIAPGPIGLGLNPAPPATAQMASDLGPREIYWAVTRGIRMTGMPAWQHRLTDRERWAVTAFVESVPTLTPAMYRDMVQQIGEAPEPGAPAPVRWTPTDAAARGRAALQQYACPTCHVIPGTQGGDARIGPSLDGVGRRLYLAGVLPNGPDAMVAWLRTPQAIKPLSAMPDLGVSEADARDMAAYLGTLR